MSVKEEQIYRQRVNTQVDVVCRWVWSPGQILWYGSKDLNVFILSDNYVWELGWLKDEGQEKHLCSNALDKEKWDGASHRLSLPRQKQLCCGNIRRVLLLLWLAFMCLSDSLNGCVSEGTYFLLFETPLLHLSSSNSNSTLAIYYYFLFYFFF